MKHRLWTLAFVSGTLAIACADEVSLPGRPCPCASGWYCCKYRNVCIPGGEFCEPAEYMKCPCDTGFSCCPASNTCVPQSSSCGVPPDPEITHHPNRAAHVPCAEMEIDQQPDGTQTEVNWVY